VLHCVGGSVLAVEPHGVSPADRQVPASGKCTTMRAICCLVTSPSFPCKPDHHTNGPPHPPPPAPPVIMAHPFSQPSLPLPAIVPATCCPTAHHEDRAIPRPSELSTWDASAAVGCRGQKGARGWVCAGHGGNETAGSAGCQSAAMVGNGHVRRVLPWWAELPALGGQQPKNMAAAKSPHRPSDWRAI